MAEISSFTQPDSSPTYVIDFLDFLDSLPDVKRIRAAAEASMHLAAGSKAVDLGCGIGGATDPQEAGTKNRAPHTCGSPFVVFLFARLIRRPWRFLPTPTACNCPGQIRQSVGGPAARV